MIQVERDDHGTPHGLNWDIVKEQIERFGGMRDYPDPQFRPQAFRELCLAVLDFADTMELAGWVNSILRSEEHCPKVSQIIERFRYEAESVRPSPVQQYQAPAAPEPTLKALMERHMQLITARQAELIANSLLSNLQEDGLKVPTRLRNELSELTEKLRPMGSGYPGWRSLPQNMRQR